MFVSARTSFFINNNNYSSGSSHILETDTFYNPTFHGNILARINTLHNNKKKIYEREKKSSQSVILSIDISGHFTSHVLCIFEWIKDIFLLLFYIKQSTDNIITFLLIQKQPLNPRRPTLDLIMLCDGKLHYLRIPYKFVVFIHENRYYKQDHRETMIIQPWARSHSYFILIWI